MANRGTTEAEWRVGGDFLGKSVIPFLETGFHGCKVQKGELLGVHMTATNDHGV